MTLTNAEQYLLELINRARLDPVGEAKRMGVDLNAGLAAGTITAASKQVLAPNALLETAAVKHSLWMLETDTFSHTGINGTMPWDRAAAEGYTYNGIGENVSWLGSTSTVNLESMVAQHHKQFFLSAGHRQGMLNEIYREVGIGQEAGRFTLGSNTYNASMVTELFGVLFTKRFVTGVAYNDRNSDNFYSIGEGVSGVVFQTGGVRTATAAAGGWALGVGSSTATAVSGTVGTLNFSATIDTTLGNVKLDVVNGTKFLTSGSITLGFGIQNVQLLGNLALNATGNSSANTITGNSGANKLIGNNGNDYLYGMAGDDRLVGGQNDDHLLGGDGNDQILGGLGIDRLYGELGNDTLQGEGGNDILTGASGADQFVFQKGGGADQITDFSISGGDHLALNHVLWSGALSAASVVRSFATVQSAGVLFNFGNGDTLLLSGLKSLTGLDTHIDIL